MKLIGPLTLLALATSTLGASLRTNEYDPDNRRSLANYNYIEYEGVCRKNSNGTGGGKDGVDYDKYMRKDDPSVDYGWCKDKCNNKSSCTGFEYSDLGADTQCEIWKKPIRGYEKKSKHNCMVKADRKHRYDVEYGAACRKYKDGTGKGNDGDEYDLYKDKSYSWCKSKCSDDSACVGFEYRWEWNEGDRQCEIWHHEIRGFETEDKWDLDCAVKVYT